MRHQQKSYHDLLQENKIRVMDQRLIDEMPGPAQFNMSIQSKNRSIDNSKL
jgi:hypothetical protein